MYRPDELRDALAQVEAELDRRRAEECRTNLLEFAKEFWPVIEQKMPFADNWHIHAIVDHLNAVTKGQLSKVIFNVPPGTSKSTFVSVLWPAWEFASEPATRVFGASYSEPLAIRDAALCRLIIGSEKYQRWYKATRIKRGSDQKTKYETTRGGWRLATTVNGQGTGQHPSRMIIDDPHNVKQSESDVERQQALDWFDGTLASRGVMHDCARIIIMQRLHEKDLTGHIMKSDNYKSWEHVIIPMEWEPREKRVYPVSSVGYKDPRTKEGELLWPAVFTKRKVAELKIELGEARSAGQLAQRPSPPGGNVYKVDQIRIWPADKPLPIFTYVLQSYDTAMTEDIDNNDPTALSTWGVFGYTEDTLYGKEPRTGVLLLEAWQEWLGYPALRKRMITDFKGEFGGDDKDPANRPRRVDRVLIENKASGISLVQDLRAKARVPVVPFNPGLNSKRARGEEAAPHMEAGNIWVLESSVEPGKLVKWARPFVSHLEVFPNGEYFDWADTFSQAVIYLTKTGHLTLPSVIDDPETEHDYQKDKRSNPYG